MSHEEEAEAWIRAHVEPAGAIELVHVRPWGTVRRVPIASGVAWFKACAPVQAFEPRLTAALAARRPDRLPEVLAHDETRAWLLLGDAGERLGFDCEHRSEEHTYELQSRPHLVCRLLLEKKNTNMN